MTTEAEQTFETSNSDLPDGESLELDAELLDAELDEESLLNLGKGSFAAEPVVAEASPQPSKEPPAEQKVAVDPERIRQLLTEITTLQAQLDERKNTYLRLSADFENFRKRTSREKEELDEKARGKLIQKLLPVVDDFERAQIQIVPKTDGEASIHKSYQSVYKQLLKCLKDQGVERMDTVGHSFDPNYHEAISQEPSPDHEEGLVSEELRPGYLFGDNVLRHALVKVSSGKVGPS
ncbi:MAG: nucleotide exchange factor GrpE [Oscillatoriales cyanobacterium SM2_2_1]|nr:nucleotide exchange factor GrpE [Oscillatoriales cyanobacterium SM2_2_1]